RRIGHALRRQDGEKRIARWVGNRNFQRLGIALRVCISQNVDRIRVTPVWREQGIERSLRIAGKRCKLSSLSNKRIRRKPSWPSRVCENGESGTAWLRLLAQHFRHVKQIGDTLNAQDTAAPKRGVEDFVAASQRTRMRRSCFRRRCRASGLDDDDR